MRELRGIQVVNALNEQFCGQIQKLRENCIVPKLAIVRVGDREDDISYEKGIMKRFASASAAVEAIALPSDVSQSILEETVASLNGDHSVHGIILFRPMPKHLCLERIKEKIAPEKDVDCMGTVNTAHVFEGDGGGYPPCTPQAVVEMLDHYQIDVTGKKTIILGRSLVVGKPLAMMLLDRNATVTLCHTKTLNLKEECRRADILISCAGTAKLIGVDYVCPGQIVIDVGINMDGGKLCGDVDFEAVAESVGAITPVPGGIGMITASVLLKHTIIGAMKALTGS